MTSNRKLDEILVQRIKDGDRTAFDELYTKYYNKIYSLVNKLIRDPHECEDCTQEAFIKIYKGIDKFEGRSALYTWMYRVSCNTAKNTLAAQAKKIYEGLDPMEAENFLTANFLQDADSPENETVTEELINLIQAGIKKLPKELKQAITYREFHCMSYEEIATAMDCPIGTVRSRIFRARDALDKIIKTAF